MTLSEKIAYCRKRAGLSQEELAARVGVSRQAVSKWELGDASPDINKLLALAKTFGVTTDWLLSEEGPAPEAGPPRTRPPKRPRPRRPTPGWTRCPARWGGSCASTGGFLACAWPSAEACSPPSVS